MDWGIEKDLMVPFKEQPEKMEAGKWYVVCVDIDGDSGRLYGSARLSKFLSNDTLTVKEGEEVDLLVWKETELGFPVIVNNTHHGLVYRDEIFKPFRVGDKTKGYVKTIREQNKLDIALEPIGYHNFNDANATFIYRMLEENDGFLDVNDKSDPEEIHARFRMSKKAFKKAVGALYKAQKIVIREEGIRLL
jgi:predicted RNA-binding protein (virulence factor B family)